MRVASANALSYLEPLQSCLSAGQSIKIKQEKAADLIALLVARSVFIPTTKIKVSFDTVRPSSSSQLYTSSKLCLSEIS